MQNYGSISNMATHRTLQFYKSSGKYKDTNFCKHSGNSEMKQQQQLFVISKTFSAEFCIETKRDFGNRISSIGP